MKKPVLRWGLLSTARINRAVIKPLRASKRNILSAVASRSSSKVEEYAKEWNIERTFDSYEAMLTDPDIDVIYNSLPNHMHAEWTIKAMQAGKHVLCEKPMALTVAELDAIAAAASQTGKVVAEAFMYRHHPQTILARELVLGGAIGKLQAIRGSFTFMMNTDVNIRLVPEMGGGSIWDIGCYPISFARYIAGAEPVEVFGQQVTGPTGVDDSFFGQMRFPGEVYAQFDSGFRTPFRTHIEIVGSEGTLTLAAPFKPGLKEKITHYTEASTETIPVPRQELYIGEVEDMADCILLGKSPRMPLSDSRGNVAAIIALLESAKTGQPVQL